MTTHFTSPIHYQFRAPGRPVEGPVRFAVGRTTMLGQVIVGRSRRGICAIFLGDDVQALRDQLASAFPAVELQEDAAALAHELDQVIAFIDGGRPAGVMSLDVGGTAFEQQVWRALCDIPSGTTRSYAGVARGLGMPDACRAVAGACAANVLALAIPCHRVVRSDGAVSGYRWGVARKRALLDREAHGDAMLATLDAR